jgi:3-oxoacyl-(acyl-carrier-protein) synthase
MPLPPVSISGVGCLCAQGLTLSDCMDSLFSNEIIPKPPTRFAREGLGDYPVFEISSIVFEDRGNTELEEAPSPTVIFACRALTEALSQARIPPESYRGKRVGVCLGTSVGAAVNLREFYAAYRTGGSPNTQPVARYLKGNPALAVAKRFGFTGPCQTVVNACSSGADAIGIGASWIREGLCDFVMAGGADELSLITYSGFIRLMITSPEPCQPFDAERKGLNLGEGAAMFILEPSGAPERAGRHTRANFVGYGAASDAHHLTAPRPDGAGLVLAINQALSQAGKDMRDIAFINAHGTGTRDNDVVEARVFNALAPSLPISATKGGTGHTLGAAGAIEAAIVIGCLERGAVPRSHGFRLRDPALPVEPIKETTPLYGQTALSTSLAFGGLNSVLALSLPTVDA